MEPEVKAFLVRVAKTLSLAVFWMLINMTFGIFFNFGFIESSITIGNVVFYVFCVGSLTVMIWYMLKIWKESLHP